METKDVEYIALETNSSQYDAMHKRVKSELGQASRYNCISCNKTADKWAWQHGQDPLIVSSYKPMCNSCHTKYDNSGFKTGHTKSQGVKCHKAKLSEEDVLDIRSKYASGNWKQYEIAYIYGITQPTVNAIVNRKTWRHI